MSNSINDWSIDLGFDSSKVDKGLSRVEKRFEKFRKKIKTNIGDGIAVKSTKQMSRSAFRRKMQQPTLLGEPRIKSSGGRLSDTRKVKAVEKQITDERRKQTKASSSLLRANTLERKRQGTGKVIGRAKSIGVDPTAAKKSLKSTDIQFIEKERLALLKRVESQEKRITAERRKQAKATAARKATQKTEKKISFKERLSTEGRISRVSSEAKFTAESLTGNRDKKAIALKAQLTSQVVKLKAAQKALANTTQVNTKKYRNLQRAIQRSTQRVSELKREVNSFRRSGGAFSTGMAKLARSLNPAALGVAGLTAAVTLGIPALFRATARLDSLKASMLAASGSAGEAAVDFEFVRGEAKRLGRDLFSSAKGFQMIGASMRGAFSKSQIKEVFLAASEASTAFGLSVDDTQGVMRAFSQIASKGTVQAEELRGQLGDRLPGAFQIAAKSMKVSTDELSRLLKQGKVVSSEFLPKFAAELRKTVTETGALAAGIDSLIASQNRFKTTQLEFVESLSDAGSTDIFKDLFKIGANFIKMFTPLGKALIKIVKPIVSFIRQAVELLEPVITAISEVVELIVDGAIAIAEWGLAIFGINDLLTDTEGKLSTLNRIVKLITIGILGIKLTFQLMGVMVDEIGAKFSEWGDDISDVVAALKEFIGLGDDEEKKVTIKKNETVQRTIEENLRRNGMGSSARKKREPLDVSNGKEKLPMIMNNVPVQQGMANASNQLSSPTIVRKTKVIHNNPVIHQENTIYEAANPDAVQAQINTATQDAIVSAYPSD